MSEWKIGGVKVAQPPAAETIMTQGAGTLGAGVGAGLGAVKGFGPEGMDALTAAGNEAGLRVGQAVSQLFNEMKRLETLQKAQQAVHEELAKQSSWIIGGVKVGMDTLEEDSSKKDMTHFSPEAEAEAKSDQEDARKMLSEKVPETRTQLHQKVREEEPETVEKLFKEKVSAEILKLASTSEEKKLIEESLRRSGYPIRRSQVWDVGDVLGKEKGKEEVLPGMVVLPVTKKASDDKEAACATPGKKIGSGGAGKGLARGGGKGPMGVPKKAMISAGVPRPFDEKTAEKKKKKRDMPDFTKQDRPEKVKDIYRALKRDHPNMPAEMKARIAARQGKPGKQKQGPPYKAPITKTAQNPMLEGGNVRYTVGPTPEDVAQYLRTQQRGGQVGEAVGMGLGAVGGGALGYMGGKQLQDFIGTGSPVLSQLAVPGAVLAGALLGGGIGKGIGGRVGQRAGGYLTGSPATQLDMPYLGQGRSGEMAQQLAQLSAMRGASSPTVAVSPGMGYGG